MAKKNSKSKKPSKLAKLKKRVRRLEKTAKAKVPYSKPAVTYSGSFGPDAPSASGEASQGVQEPPARFLATD